MEKQNTIFIFALLGRSGSNFLANLLALHPSCRLADSPYLENWFLAESKLLIDYAENLERIYTERNYPGHEESRALICRAMGQTLTSLLSDDPSNENHIVTKTPSLEGISYFQDLFPANRPLILIRDGRSVVESFHKSFGSDRRDVAMWWRNAAKRYLEIRDASLIDYLPVYYEELVNETENQMRRILAFLGIAESGYDFYQASRIPVVGSSSFGRNSEELNWTPVSKTESFKPLTRFSRWTSADHRIFNDIAGREMELLGYSLA